MSIGFCTSGSAAKTEAVNPGGKWIAAALSAGLGCRWEAASGSVSSGEGNVEAGKFGCDAARTSSAAPLGFGVKFALESSAADKDVKNRAIATAPVQRARPR
ncbi:hypothetical protein RSSM_02758 [Rhodopirellula sallentina SM41]|uniref:Uncharacterized protein n=1 Tax=Rhodopirellula sallentina SM41 TaxID=1263870 RepID=M5U2X7_9BACT|nr:hypothetical protein RSSM_02758 [Rhodopirellula sallentina SM41]